ncbi:MAG: Glycosyl transferase group 1 [Candidatus Peregrinibacteria bacterium GW2011_GWA2_47_7]|nr:MAG: Glycosyl transferase group 1 [Candidatus Peregrinibacteria bacterium GW2011_GWA2_47_7]
MALATEKFILGVGTLEPRKNFKTLIEAFSLFHKKHPNVSLLIAGGKGWKEKYEVPKNLPIQFLGYAPEHVLKNLYMNARALVFPSLYEGFGMPPLEAMALGCPVVCSNTGSLPEVVGDCALMIDPNNAREIAEALEKLFGDDDLRTELITKGHLRAKEFSWKKSAEELIKLFQKISD